MEFLSYIIAGFIVSGVITFIYSFCVICIVTFFDCADNRCSFWKECFNTFKHKFIWGWMAAASIIISIVVFSAMYAEKNKSKLTCICPNCQHTLKIKE